MKDKNEIQYLITTLSKGFSECEYSITTITDNKESIILKGYDKQNPYTVLRVAMPYRYCSIYVSLTTYYRGQEFRIHNVLNAFEVNFLESVVACGNHIRQSIINGIKKQKEFDEKAKAALESDYNFKKK